MNLETMEELSKSCQTSALSEFHEKVLDVLEPLLPLKTKKLSAKMGMMRRLLCRRLSKLRRRVTTALYIHKLNIYIQHMGHMLQD